MSLKAALNPERKPSNPLEPNPMAENSENIAENASGDTRPKGFDYSYVKTVARIAVYDNLQSAPRVTEVEPAGTAEYIMSIASKTYEQARLMGGSIPFTIIQEVSENFIHAQFAEVVVSILDDGNTIRFADQGPGIADAEKAQIPGFSSAIEPMKRYIRGVGSGLPIVRDYFDGQQGTVTVENNIRAGAVVTISLNKKEGRAQPHSPQQQRAERTAAAEAPHRTTARLQSRIPLPPLSNRERDILKLILSEGEMRVTDISNELGIPVSSTHVALGKLEEANLLARGQNRARMLTDYGYDVAASL